MGIGAGIAAAGVAGAAGSALGGSAAASAQASAANTAANTQRELFALTQQKLGPFQQQGINAQDALAPLIGTDTGNPLAARLTKPFDFTEAQLEQTPGYQFTLDQGLKATQNSYAAQGLANSGAALKGAARFATGLADATFQQQFGNYWGQNQAIYNMLAGQQSLGENAAAGVGNAATATGQGIANAQIGAGNAAAAGLTAAGGAFGQAATSVSNGLLLNGLLSRGGAGAGIGSGISTSVFSDNLSPGFLAAAG